jgi:hypothetical protein
MKTIHFPHISRLFSADSGLPFLKTAIWSVLCAFIIINVRVSEIHKEKLSDVVDEMAHTTGATLDTSLSEKFRLAGNLAVSRELQVAALTSVSKDQTDPQGTDSVLGTQSVSEAYWEKVLEEHPDFRDAYIAAAKYAIMGKNYGKALEYLKHVRSIDPNNQMAQFLEKMLGNVPSR